MKIGAFQGAIRMMLGTSFRTQGVHPRTPLLSYVYSFGSDLLYICFGRRPFSFGQDDLLCHVINSLSTRRRIAMIDVFQRRVKLEEVASLMGISVARTVRLLHSAMESARRRCLWHGVELYRVAPPPPVRESEVGAGCINVEIQAEDIDRCPLANN